MTIWARDAPGKESLAQTVEDLAVEQLIACSTPLTSRLRRAAEQLARSLAQWQNHFRLGSGIDYSHLA
jgi:hypothetical protein